MQPLRGTPLPDGTVALFTKIMQTHMRFVKKITQKISAYSLICNLPKPTNHVLVCMPSDMQKTWMERCLKRLSIENLEVLYSFSSLGFPLAAQLRPQNQCDCNAVLPTLKAACCRRSCGLSEQLITTLSAELGALFPSTRRPDELSRVRAAPPHFCNSPAEETRLCKRDAN